MLNLPRRPKAVQTGVVGCTVVLPLLSKLVANAPIHYVLFVRAQCGVIGRRFVRQCYRNSKPIEDVKTV